MRLVKFERKPCPKCDSVQNYLDNKSVEVEKINIDNHPDLEFISKHVDMSVPVVVLLDDNDELIQKTVGFDVEGLDKIVEKLN